MAPGIFLPWTLPEDPEQKDCKGGTGGGGGGAVAYRRNICNCNRSSISLDTEYELKTGNMVGPTWQGVNELIEQDPGRTGTRHQHRQGIGVGVGRVPESRIIK
jgi:hypothetical protein